MADAEPFQFDVFISYSSRDKAWVRGELLPRIEQAGVKVCIDFRDFKAGRSSLFNMQDAVRHSRRLLPVLSPNWFASEWTLFEGLIAGRTAPAGLHQRIVPARLQSCDFPDDADFIAALTHIDFTDGADHDLAWRQLLTALGKPPESEPERTLKMFISYRRDDNPYAAHHLFDRLTAHFGKESVFIDVDNIPYGVDFVEHLAGEVQKCNCFLAIIGDRWLDLRYEDGPSKGERRVDDELDFVRIEIESALARRIPVIPVLVGRAQMPRDKDLPEALKKLARMNAAEVRAGPDMEAQIRRLLRAIENMKG